MIICECDRCGEEFSEYELYDWAYGLLCATCLETEQDERLDRETYARLATCGIAHVFESDNTMVSEAS